MRSAVTCKLRSAFPLYSGAIVDFESSARLVYLTRFLFDHYCRVVIFLDFSALSFSDLSKEKKVKAVIVESFSSDSEEVKSAAAYALGM